MTVERDDRRETPCAADWPIIERALAAAEKRMCSGLRVHVCVMLTDDEGIRGINLQTRGINAATDVLSFPTINWRSPADPSRLRRAPRDPETGGIALGDIVISTQRAASQAEEYGHGYLRELSYLAVHAMLHLLGYDHIDDSARRAMRAEEEAVLAGTEGGGRGYGGTIRGAAPDTPARDIVP